MSRELTETASELPNRANNLLSAHRSRRSSEPAGEGFRGGGGGGGGGGGAGAGRGRGRARRGEGSDQTWEEEAIRPIAGYTRASLQCHQRLSRSPTRCTPQIRD
ncbi:g4967 [Coccomyxa elongata]